jgi:hypothetical protein
MKLVRAVWWTVLLARIVCASEQPSAAGIVAAVREMSIDPARTYRVRDLQLARGDIKIYLSEGILSFVAPVAGQTIGAIFTTADVEGGDGEMIVLPPHRSERASLATFTKSPNLDEHFNSALFIFTDGTMQELMKQMEERSIHPFPAPDGFASKWNPVVHNVSSDLGLRVAESLLDNHKPVDGFFYGLIGSRNLGAVDVSYQPQDLEPITLGRLVHEDSGPAKFQLWTSFRPRRAPLYASALAAVSDYRIDTTIHSDLTLSATAKFRLKANNSARVAGFYLSNRLRVTSGTINGQKAEVYQSVFNGIADDQEMGRFLLVSDSPLVAGEQYEIEVRYEGSVIRRMLDGSYFVSERNAWIPHTGPTLAMFDMTFRCPENLRLVSTGELVSEKIASNTRIIHRKTLAAERFAGFNLGNYDVAGGDQGRYRVECYSNKPSIAGLQKDGGAVISSSQEPDEVASAILAETRRLLDNYTERWGSLPIHSLVVSPIPAYIGQGFPGLIYLSTVTYLREKDRPAKLRNPATDTFFSQMLLPHETAHQWWGNIVTAADYRTEWLMEAMANDAALEVLGQRKGKAAMEQVLAQYRNDLLEQRNGIRVEQGGPVDFGSRLSQTWDLRTWQVVVYEKGAWILQMLRKRLGDDGFLKMQVRLLRDFPNKPISNEDLRKTASEFVPAGQPDRSLELFFDTWVYGTGIPVIKLNRKGPDWVAFVTGVDDDFAVDLPIYCQLKTSREKARPITPYWMRVTSGENPLELPGKPVACRLPADDEFLYLH